MIRQATLPLLFALAPVLHPDPEAALERKLRKAVLRREPISLGTLAAPYEPATGREASPLEALLKEEGLEVSIITATPRILREIDLLVDLDRRHSVTVRMAVPVTEDPGPRMRTVHALAAEGIATSVLLSGTVSEEKLRALLQEAWEARAWDVEIEAGSSKRSRKAPPLDVFRRLRLEYGFPRGVAGRG